MSVRSSEIYKDVNDDLFPKILYSVLHFSTSRIFASRAMSISFGESQTGLVAESERASSSERFAQNI